MRLSIFIAILILSSCEGYLGERETDLIKEIKSNNILCLQFKCDGIPCSQALADGNTKIEINTIVPSEIEDSKNSIKITTGNGTFSSSDSSESKSLTAIKTERNLIDMNQCGNNNLPIKVATDTLITSITPNRFSVEMEVDILKKNVRFEFLKADIESVSLSADRFSILNTPQSEATLVAKGNRAKGQPSMGQNIVFKLELADGTVIDDDWKFRNTRNKTNESNEATTTFTVGDIDYVGELFCIACVDEVIAGAICDTVQIKVLDDE